MSLIHPPSYFNNTNTINLLKSECFNYLPQEIINYIFSFLDRGSLNNCLLVCKRFKTIINSHYPLKERILRILLPFVLKDRLEKIENEEDLKKILSDGHKLYSKLKNSPFEKKQITYARNILSFCLKNKCIAVGSTNSAISLFNRVTREKVKELKGHTGEIFHLEALEGKNPLIISSSNDETIKIWDYTKPKAIATIKADHVSTSFYVDKDYVMSGSREGVVKLWDTPTQTNTRDIVDNKTLVSCLNLNKNLMVGGCSDGMVMLWDLRVEIKSFSLKSHQNWVTAVKFTSDFSLLSSSRDGCVKRWDIRSPNKPLEKEVIYDTHSNLTKKPLPSIISMDVFNNLLIMGSKDGIIWVGNYCENSPWRKISLSEKDTAMYTSFRLDEVGLVTSDDRFLNLFNFSYPSLSENYLPNPFKRKYEGDENTTSGFLKKILN